MLYVAFLIFFTQRTFPAGQVCVKPLGPRHMYKEDILMSGCRSCPQTQIPPASTQG